MPKNAYGRSWPDSLSDLEIDLAAFKKIRNKHTDIPQQDLPPIFKRIARKFWPTNAKPPRLPFIWHPWADDMLEEACKTKYLALNGCASSGKTEFCAIWALINWLCAPTSTCVLVTSTGVKEARQRIWGSIVKYYNSYPGWPGKLLDSVCMIRTDDGTATRYDAKCGIHVVAGDKSKEKENIQKLIGIHVQHVILIADELPELSPALYEAAVGNLATAPYFQFIGSGNFKGLYDCFGPFCEPKEGWLSVDQTSERWETKDGVCLHFNGEQSPNVKLGEDKWPIYGCRTLEQHRKQPGQHTAGYWRMCISMPSQDAEENTIYPQSAFIRGHAHDAPIWIDTPIPCASLDPAFVTGGDKAIATFGLYGKDKSGKMVLAVTRSVEVREDRRNDRESKPIQIAKRFRDMCIDANIAPENAAYDASGGGVVFGSLLSEFWSTKLLAVQFGGAPSELRVSMADHRTGKQSYQNRVSELWYCGLDFVQSEQIRGLPGVVAKELQARRFETSKQGEFLKVRVESKTEMRVRTGGKSPDAADSWVILLELARRRFGFAVGGIGNARTVVKDKWKQKVLKTNQLYDQDSLYQPEELVAL